MSRGQDENGSETVRGLVCVGTRVRADCCEICARGESDVVVDVDSRYLFGFALRCLWCRFSVSECVVFPPHLSVRRWRLPSLIIFSLQNLRIKMKMKSPTMAPLTSWTVLLVAGCCSAFNIDIGNHMMYYSNQTDSMFGFAVAQHKYRGQSR